MGRLFRYILRNNFVFLFVLLEILAFVLVVQNNYQQASFVRSTNALTGNMMNTANNISSYFYLSKANKELQEENRQLRKQLATSFLYRDTTVFYVQDSLFSFINANVIRNSIGKQKNFFFIDKGRNHGVKTNMGVIGTSGIAGIVVEVSNNFSRVMSLLNIQTRINAKIKNNNHLGVVKWHGDDYKKAWLTDIPQHVTINQGDTVTTSGNSQIFPEGLIIGKLNGNFHNESRKFKDAEVDLCLDFNSLEYVMVVNNLFITELDSIKSTTNE